MKLTERNIERNQIPVAERLVTRFYICDDTVPLSCPVSRHDGILPAVLCAPAVPSVYRRNWYVSEENKKTTLKRKVIHNSFLT